MSTPEIIEDRTVRLNDTAQRLTPNSLPPDSGGGCPPHWARPVLKPWQYRWNTLDANSFEEHGVLAIRSPRLRPCFNFPQIIRLYPQVAMDWSTRYTRAVETLAVNILLQFSWAAAEREWRVNRDISRPLRQDAQDFAELFLTTMPASGGVIPREVILTWLQDLC